MEENKTFYPVLPGHFGSWSLPIGEAAGLGASLWLRQHEIRQLSDQRRRYLLRRRRFELVGWVKCLSWVKWVTMGC